MIDKAGRFDREAQSDTFEISLTLSAKAESRESAWRGRWSDGGAVEGTRRSTVEHDLDLRFVHGDQGRLHWHHQACEAFSGSNVASSKSNTDAKSIFSCPGAERKEVAEVAPWRWQGCALHHARLALFLFLIASTVTLRESSLTKTRSVACILRCFDPSIHRSFPHPI